MIKVLIADDHAIVRRGLKQIVEETSDIVVGGEAGNAGEVLSKITANDWDVLVLDITMPGRSGLDILRDIKQACPKIAVLILSIHDEEHFTKRALKMGAAGYLAKDSAPDELVKAIRKVYAGGKYVSPAQAEKLVYRLGSTDTAMHERLSDREHEILCQMASGKTVTQIAEVIKLSVKTVSTYRMRLLQKMKMTTNAELIRYAIQKRLVE